MILKILFCLVLTVAWINKASCASVSKVYYIQNGGEPLPLEYYQYGAPGLAYASPQIAQLSAASANSAVPVSSGYIPPCVAPCVYPGQTIASFAPIQSNTNLLSYQSPVSSLPIATSNLNDPAGYKYEYVVYDQNTGDKKSQSEMSDGSIVRGEYSFLQPDGYVREVQYVADDVKGFSAIITNYLPNTEESKDVTTGETKSATNCPPVKSEPIKHSESVLETVSLGAEKHAGTHENNVEGAVVHAQESHGETSIRGEEKVHGGSKETVLVEPHENIPLNKEVLSTEVHNSNEGHELKMPTAPKSTETVADASILVPYKDIMKCIESLLSKTTMVQTESPLAYIVLNKPC